ncbi:MAG: hypothetical protein ABIG99_03140, partial [Patescibacteria group bacterium]
MKFIFDFDDVLFYNTKQLKEHMYICLEKVGVSRNIVEPYYTEARKKEFSLKNLISSLVARENIKQINIKDICEEIMNECKNFVNKELLEVIKKIGKENCFLISYGQEKFQQEKIKRTSVASLFSKIIIVQESKKEAVEKICARYKDEEVIFIDDKAHHFKDLDFKKYP